MQTNQYLLDSAIRHQIYTQRYAGGLVKEILALLNESDAEIVAKLQHVPDGFGAARLRALLASIRSIIKNSYDDSLRVLESNLVDGAEYESAYQQRNFLTAIGMEVAIDAPSIGALEAIVSTEPMQGALLKEWFSELSDKKYIRVRNQLRQGLLQGETVADMVRRLRGTRSAKYRDGVLDIDRRGAEAIVRTATNSVMTSARLAFYQSNDSVIKGLRWVSTLDGRTSPVCRARDGKIYPMDTAIRPPAHINCRSTMVAITKSWRELGIDADEVPEGVRSSMNGDVPEKLVYNDWLKRQPKSFVEDVLGSARAKLFLDGGVTLDRFVDRSGKNYTLSELRQKESEAFKKTDI